jgi:hypothetical protein
MIVKIHVSDALCISKKLVQFRFPKRNSKRIRKKWFKNSANWHFVEKHEVVIAVGEVYLSQKYFDEYQSALTKQQNVGI